MFEFVLCCYNGPLLYSPPFHCYNKISRQAISEESLNSSVPARPMEDSSTAAGGWKEGGNRVAVWEARERGHWARLGIFFEEITKVW